MYSHSLKLFWWKIVKSKIGTFTNFSYFVVLVYYFFKLAFEDFSVPRFLLESILTVKWLVSEEGFWLLFLSVEPEVLLSWQGLKGECKICLLSSKAYSTLGLLRDLSLFLFVFNVKALFFSVSQWQCLLPHDSHSIGSLETVWMLVMCHNLYQHYQRSQFVQNYTTNHILDFWPYVNVT